MKYIKDKLYEININGFDMFYSVKTDDLNKPLLLFLHGGPGGGNISLSSILEKKTTLTKDFTIIQYDQRGAGLSYHESMTKNDLSLEYLLDDTTKFIDYLLKKYNKKKLLIVGHSFGTILGLKLCKLMPKKLLGYVSIAQLLHPLEGELKCLQDTFLASKEYKNGKYDKQLLESELYLNDGRGSDYILSQRDVMLRLGLITYKPRPMSPKLFYWINILSSHCRIRDIKNFIEGMSLSTKAMWDDIIKLNLSDEIKEIDVPVLFIAGLHDKIARIEFIEDYVQNLKAPYKQLEVYKLSGHTAHGEEKDKYEKHVIQFMCHLSDV